MNEPFNTKHQWNSRGTRPKTVTRRWGAYPPPSSPAQDSTTRHGKNINTGKTPTNKPMNKSTNARLNVSTDVREKYLTKKSHHKPKFSSSK